MVGGVRGRRAVSCLLRLHTRGPRIRPRLSCRRGPRGRELHDRRRPPSPRLVRPVKEWCGGDLLPGPQRHAEAGADTRAARLRRSPLRQARGRRERGRPERVRLGRVSRRRRGRALPQGATGRRAWSNRRYRPLCRRRDDARGHRTDTQARRGRLRGRGRALDPGVPRHDSQHQQEVARTAFLCRADCRRPACSRTACRRQASRISARGSRRRRSSSSTASTARRASEI